MSAGAAERVFPPQSSPAPGGAGPSVPGTFKPDKKLLMWGGAGVVLVLGLVAASKAPPEGDPEASGETADAYELDTRDTDVYNELQPELEQIADALNNLDRPRPAQPQPPKAGNPRPPKKGPRPPHKGDRGSRHVVKNGETLRAIAVQHRVKGGRARLYTVNRQAIERAAKQHGRKNSGQGRHLYAGTVLRIP